MYKVMLDTDRGCMDDHEAVIMDGLETFENELIKRGSKFFGGSEPGMLDLMIWPWCERADLLPILAGNQFAMKKDRFKHLVCFLN